MGLNTDMVILFEASREKEGVLIQEVDKLALAMSEELFSKKIMGEELLRDAKDSRIRMAPQQKLY